MKMDVKLTRFLPLEPEQVGLTRAHHVYFHIICVQTCSKLKSVFSQMPSKPTQSPFQKDSVMAMMGSSAYYWSATLMSASIIPLRRTICLYKYFFFCFVFFPVLAPVMAPRAGRGPVSDVVCHAVGRLAWESLAHGGVSPALIWICPSPIMPLHSATIHYHTPLTCATPTTCLGAGALICMK